MKPSQIRIPLLSTMLTIAWAGVGSDVHQQWRVVGRITAEHSLLPHPLKEIQRYSCTGIKNKDVSNVA